MSGVPLGADAGAAAESGAPYTAGFAIFWGGLRDWWLGTDGAVGALVLWSPARLRPVDHCGASGRRYGW